MTRLPLTLVLALCACTMEQPTTRAPLQQNADGPTITLADAAAGAGSDTTAPGVDQGPPPAPDASAPAPTPDTTPGGSQPALSGAERDLLDAINAARAKLGLSQLVADPQLLCAARDAARIVPGTGNCGHVGSDGSWPHDRAKRCGMSEAASWKVNEIAAGPGFNDGADAVWGWSQSSGHWWGLTHPQATRIGVAATSKGCFWAVFDCCIKGS